MTVMADDTDDLEDLMPDDLLPSTPSRGASKGNAVPVQRTAKQQAAAAARAEKAREEADLRTAADAKKAQAARLAQVVNLHIAGFSLAEIGASIGASEDEIDRMLASDTQRYVRNQPALRAYVRNFVSGKYNALLDTVWKRATDATHSENLEAVDRAMRIVDRMARLHGAEAPTQSEIKVDAVPESVDKLVSAIAAAQGIGYDTSIFDVIDGEVVHDSAQAQPAALEAASAAVEADQPEDGEGL